MLVGTAQAVNCTSTKEMVLFLPWCVHVFVCLTISKISQRVSIGKLFRTGIVLCTKLLFFVHLSLPLCCHGDAVPIDLELKFRR